jgi:hypothetical protein
MVRSFNLFAVARPTATTGASRKGYGIPLAILDMSSLLRPILVDS